MGTRKKLLIIVLAILGIAALVAGTQFLLNRRSAPVITKVSPRHSTTLTLDAQNGMLYFDESNAIASYNLSNGQHQEFLPYDNATYRISPGGTYIAKQGASGDYDIHQTSNRQVVERIPGLSLSWIDGSTFVYFAPTLQTPEGDSQGNIMKKAVGQPAQVLLADQPVTNLFAFSNGGVGIIQEDETGGGTAIRLFSPAGQQIFYDPSLRVNAVNPLYPQSFILALRPTITDDIGSFVLLDQSGSATNAGFDGSLNGAEALTSNTLLFYQRAGSRVYFKSFDTTSKQTKDLFDIPDVGHIYAVRGYQNKVIINSVSGVFVVEY